MLAAILLASLFWRFRVIENSMPYPQHVDEMYLADKGANILKTGDFNPHFFMYPGLPIYLTAAAMTYGYLDAANHLELQNTSQIGYVGYPYYEHPRVVRPARRLFALISVIGLALIGLVARELRSAPPGKFQPDDPAKPQSSCRAALAAMVLAAAWLALSSLYFEQSQSYLNVNIVGSAFAWATILLVLRWLPRQDWLAKAIWPGVLVGAVVACKYNFATVALAPLLALLFYGGRRRLGKTFVLLAAMGATFLLCAPYTLLDFKTFLDDLALITHIYREGSFGVPESKTFGSHLLLTLREIQQDFGAGGTLFVLAGAFALFRRDPRRALIATVFPVLLLLQMCSLPTHLMRNLVPFLPLWALLGALGVVAAARWLAAAAAAWPPLGRRSAPQRAALALAALLAGLALLLPLGAPGRWLAFPLASRQQATAWLIANAPKDRPVIVASEIGFHPRPFAAAGVELRTIAWRSLSASALLAELARNPDSLVVAPHMGAVHWEPRMVTLGEKMLPRMAALLTEIEPLQTFGSQPVSVNFDSPPGGDPLFVVGRPRRSAETLAELARGQLLLPRDFHGEQSELQSLGFAILGQRPVRSTEIELAAGSYRLSIEALGSAAKDRFPMLRVSFGDLYLGRFIAGDTPGFATFDFALNAPRKAAISLEMLNDDVERDAQGAIVADRNAWLQGVFVHSLAAPPPEVPAADAKTASGAMPRHGPSLAAGS